MKTIRKKLYQIIFHTDTKAGKIFDVVLLVFILLNVLAVLLESVSKIYEQYGIYLRIFEYSVTVIFTIEYLLRIWIHKRRWKYIFSFYGIIDLLSILPTLL